MFKHLIYHDLIEVIDLRNCAINYKIFQYLTQHFPRLTTLHLGQTEINYLLIGLSMSSFQHVQSTKTIFSRNLH